jgi:flagellar biosynthesis/type III secretory pathway chaperone
VDQSACREQFAALLNQESGALEMLAGLLEREHVLLVANDVDALEPAMAERQTCVGALLRIDEERRSMCRMLGHTADNAGLERLVKWCDPSGTLTARFAECAKRGTRCRELNDRNGALVIARMKRVETLLGALTGRPGEAPTYGRSGTSTASRATGGVLTTQA